jgi:hypothetical protein
MPLVCGLRACDRVEARGVDNHVEFVRGIPGPDTARRDPLDRSTGLTFGWL